MWASGTCHGGRMGREISFRRRTVRENVYPRKIGVPTNRLDRRGSPNWTHGNLNRRLPRSVSGTLGGDAGDYFRKRRIWLVPHLALCPGHWLRLTPKNGSSQFRKQRKVRNF